jgi:hypothetical protein
VIEGTSDGSGVIEIEAAFPTNAVSFRDFFIEAAFTPDTGIEEISDGSEVVEIETVFLF